MTRQFDSQPCPGRGRQRPGGLLSRLALLAGLLTAGTTAPLAATSYFTVTPCRVYDTRGEVIPLVGWHEHTIQIEGVCGVPPEASQVALNLTIILPDEEGALAAHAEDAAIPASAVVVFLAGQTRANSAIVELSGAGAINVMAHMPPNPLPILPVPSFTDLVVDVVGYFQ